MQPLFRPLGEHTVWREGDRFIKVPRNPSFFLDVSDDYISSLSQNIKYIMEHFHDFLIIPETIIERDSKYGYRIKQRAVKGCPINMFQLPKDSEFSQRLQQLFDHNFNLWRTTMQGLDFYGTDGVYAPHLLHNLWIDTEGNLVLLDIGLLRANARNYYFRHMSHIFFHLQNMLFMSSRHTIGGFISWKQTIRRKQKNQTK